MHRDVYLRYQLKYCHTDKSVLPASFPELGLFPHSACTRTVSYCTGSCTSLGYGCFKRVRTPVEGIIANIIH